MLHPSSVWPAAVSPLVAHVLSRAERPARVLAAFPTALYLAADHHEEVVPVLAHDALRLPTGLLLARRSIDIDWGVGAGDTVLVGGGRVRLPGHEVVVVRTHRPPKVPWGTQGGLAAYVPASVADASPLLRRAATDLVRAALRREPVNPVVAGIVGGGPGLTPSGDDALCGVLLGLRAAGAVPAHHRVAEAVRGLTRATTSLSASLLLAAIDGYAVPEVVRLVILLTTPTAPAVGAALERVLAIGHSSGADLCAGLAGALLACHEHALESFAMFAHQEGARRA